MTPAEPRATRLRDLAAVLALFALTIAGIAVVPSLACGLSCRVYDAARGVP